MNLKKKSFQTQQYCLVCLLKLVKNKYIINFKIQTKSFLSIKFSKYYCSTLAVSSCEISIEQFVIWRLSLLGLLAKIKCYLMPKILCTSLTHFFFFPASWTFNDCWQEMCRWPGPEEGLPHGGERGSGRRTVCLSCPPARPWGATDELASWLSHVRGNCPFA